MNRRALLLAFVAVLLLVGGLLAYRHKANQAAADCADKPKPKDEFTMAAPCDTGAEAPKGAPAPAPPR
jgi:hypothetical protein